MKRLNGVASRNSRTASGAALQAVPIELGEPNSDGYCPEKTHAYIYNKLRESVEIHESHLIREHANIQNYRSIAHHLYL